MIKTVFEIFGGNEKAKESFYKYLSIKDGRSYVEWSAVFTPLLHPKDYTQDILDFLETKGYYIELIRNKEMYESRCLAENTRFYYSQGGERMTVIEEAIERIIKEL